MFHPSVRLVIVSFQCTPVFVLGRNAGHTPRVLLVPVHSLTLSNVSSLLQIFFTSLPFSLHFSSCVFHLCESFVWSRVVFVLFRSPISSRVSKEIHLSLLVPILLPSIFAVLSVMPLTNICQCSSTSVEYSRAANLLVV